MTISERTKKIMNLAGAAAIERELTEAIAEARAVERERIATVVESIKQSRDPEVIRGVEGEELDSEGYRELHPRERWMRNALAKLIRSLGDDPK